MATTDAAEGAEETAPKNRSKLPMLLGMLLAIVLGAGGFFAAYSGFLPFGVAPSETEETKDEMEGQPPKQEVAFVQLDPMVVSLGSPGQSRHLRFRAQAEVKPGYQSDVTELMPRIIDTLNGYLRAIPIEELETPAALVLLRSQMLRRIQLVTPEGTVRDLLIMEFVLN